VLINTETGKSFESRTYLGGVTKSDFGRIKEITRATYRDIFNSAKQDMLGVAIKKSKRVPAEKENAVEAPQHLQQPTQSAAVEQDSQPANVMPRQEAHPGDQKQKPAREKPSSTAEERKEQREQPAERRAETQAQLNPTTLERKKEEEKALYQDAPAVSGTKLVVYDMESPIQQRPVALILSEALREELFLLKRFTLVNRENLEQVLKEMALQQTGLISEEEAVRTGRGLAASQVVTGQIGLLGKTYMLQAKRIDVESFATLGHASAKFVQGQEDEIFSKLPGLARSLAGLEE
jgi:hypothetical protein